MRDRSPFNAEPPPSVLGDAEITALDAFYSRNHGPFPDSAPNQWRLKVDGLMLADVLEAAGVPDDDGLHVAFGAPDVAAEGVPVQSYGGSTPDVCFPRCLTSIPGTACLSNALISSTGPFGSERGEAVPPMSSILDVRLIR